MTNGEEDPGKTPQGVILGWFFTIMAMMPYFIWVVELFMYLLEHPHDDFSPMVEVGDIWMLTIPAIAVGVGLAAGYGNEIVEAAIERIKGDSDG